MQISQRSNAHNEENCEPQLVDMSEHFARLCRFLYRDADVDGDVAGSIFDSVAEPLRIGGSVEKVIISSNIIDPLSGAMCSSAADYDNAVAAATESYVSAVTRFMWSWIAFENLSKFCCHGSHRMSSANKVIEYIKNGKGTNIVGVESVYHKAIELSSEQIKKNLSKLVKRSGSEKFLYIHLCRETRNEFVHAHQHVVRHPEEEDGNDANIYYDCLTRLVLFAIQAALAVYFHDNDDLTGSIMESEGIPANLKLSTAIKKLHLVEQLNSNENQLDLNI